MVFTLFLCFNFGLQWTWIVSSRIARVHQRHRKVHGLSLRNGARASGRHHLAECHHAGSRGICTCPQGLQAQRPPLHRFHRQGFVCDIALSWCRFPHGNTCSSVLLKKRGAKICRLHLMPVMTDFLLTGCIGWDVLKLFWKKKRSPNPRHARKKNTAMICNDSMIVKSVICRFTEGHLVWHIVTSYQGRFQEVLRGQIGHSAQLGQPWTQPWSWGLFSQPWTQPWSWGLFSQPWGHQENQVQMVILIILLPGWICCQKLVIDLKVLLKCINCEDHSCCGEPSRKILVDFRESNSFIRGSFPKVARGSEGRIGSGSFHCVVLYSGHLPFASYVAARASKGDALPQPNTMVLKRILGPAARTA